MFLYSNRCKLLNALLYEKYTDQWTVFKWRHWLIEIDHFFSLQILDIFEIWYINMQLLFHIHMRDFYHEGLKKFSFQIAY